MTLTEAILSLHPSARFGSDAQSGDFVVGQVLDDKGAVGPEAVL